MAASAFNTRRRWTRSIRPQIQRVFLAWFAENRHRFLVPLRITRRTDREIHFRFVGISAAISARLNRDCLWVNVTHEGEWFDALAAFDVCNPKRVQSGYICGWNMRADPKSHHEVFATREALWYSHVCEDFLKWVNDRLAPARWLRVSCTAGDGIRSARLVEEDSDRALPVDVAQLGRLHRLDGTYILNSGDVIDVWMYPIDGDEPTEQEAWELTPEYDDIE